MENLGKFRENVESSIFMPQKIFLFFSTFFMKISIDLLFSCKWKILIKNKWKIFISFQRRIQNKRKTFYQKKKRRNFQLFSVFPSSWTMDSKIEIARKIQEKKENFSIFHQQKILQENLMENPSFEFSFVVFSENFQNFLIF